MAEDSDLERTEPASPRRLEKAREEGDVPRSRELSTCITLLIAGLVFWYFGGNLVRELQSMLKASLSFDHTLAFDFAAWIEQLLYQLKKILIVFIPLGFLLFFAALAAPLLLGGWVFSTQALLPNFSRLNPIQGISKLFSVNSLAELAKALLKSFFVGLVASLVVWHQKEAILTLSLVSLPQGIAQLMYLLNSGFLLMAGALAVIAIIDVPYQLWHYANKLKMTKEEVKREISESDGNPQIKARIRSQQRAMARRRMMAKVPTADVIVTNPTHYAVALKYHEGKMRAPIVVAKGADHVAANIRAKALENHVPLLEAPSLARALYKNVELDQEIPLTLYKVVAEVLAYVFQLRVYQKQGGVKPEPPQLADIPSALAS